MNVQRGNKGVTLNIFISDLNGDGWMFNPRCTRFTHRKEPPYPMYRKSGEIQGRSEYCEEKIA